ncbi:2OG-Fe(II) oxygenase [Acaryochloris sp. IP29b_bin.137]|uniref:2OG-Fe(II) oxygenase n=1 Tax=Acaryochloris sp. IP29b_bin.137 TaxID=2969217 RepID=UPI00263589F0|nr:2OG-Fe(II) oxygenase [Acaryochloris sp. IP29b_bin.137]
MTPPPTVKVELLLQGGHHQTVYLQSSDPLLQRLFQAVLPSSQRPRPPELFQIPLQAGHAGLCFSSEHLVGLVTEPPMYIQSALDPAPTPEVIPSPYVQMDQFLTAAEHQALLQAAIQQEVLFMPTQTTTDTPDYRQSMILPDLDGLADRVMERIEQVLPKVLTQLKLPSFKPSEIETQLTSHNDGNFYKLHNDNGSPDTATRELTYVYYFYKEPKPFSGGELRVYDSKIENNFYVAADSFQTVDPRNNSIVFFLSRYMHEVLPVSCPSQDFADSRFTINGWIRR